MSLDPMPDAATLLRMKAEREGRRVEPSRPLLAAFRAIESLPPRVPLEGCRAVEAVTASNDGYYESPCHPGIYLTDSPPAATPECAWHYVSHRNGR